MRGVLSFFLWSCLCAGSAGLLAACQADSPGTGRAAGVAAGAPAGAAARAATAFRYVTDDLGHRLRVPAHPLRVLPLAPSMTEMLWAVATPEQVAGRTQNCNYPAAAQAKPVINTYPLDVEGLLRLKPDLVLTVEGMTSAGHLAQLAKLGIPVYQQRYTQVADIPRALAELGRLLGRPARGQHVADSLRRVLAALRVRPTPAAAPAVRVLAITWTDPIFVYGQPTLFTSVLHWVGAANASPPDNPQPYPTLPRETVLQLNPDVLLGGDFAALDTTLFRRYPELRQVRAYRNRQVFAIDDDLLSRPSPRIGQLLEAVRARLVPAPAPSPARVPAPSPTLLPRAR